MSLLAAITWEDNAIFTITFLINTYCIWVCLSGFICTVLHDIKQYSSYKITIFPSFINTLYWKSLVYHGFYLKSFLPPNTQKSLKALIFSTFLSSPVLSCGKQAFCFYNMIKQYFSDKTYYYKFFRALSLLSVVFKRQFL